MSLMWYLQNWSVSFNTHVCYVFMPPTFFSFFFLIPIVLFDIHAQSFILIWPLQLTVYLSLTLKNLVIFVLWSGVIFTVMHVTIYICRGKICLVEFICTSDWQSSVVWSGTEFTIETTVVTGLQETYKGKCVHWTSAKCDKSLKQVRSCMTFFFFLHPLYSSEQHTQNKTRTQLMPCFS